MQYDLNPEEAQIINNFRDIKAGARKKELAEEIQELVKPTYFNGIGPLMTEISKAIVRHGFIAPDFTIDVGILPGTSWSKLFLITDKWGISVSLYLMESGKFEVVAYLT